MSATDFNDLIRHAEHSITIATYYDLHLNTVNVAIECEECSEVLMDYDNPEFVSEEEDTRTYCEECNKNFDENEFDTRYESRPVCFGCSTKDDEDTDFPVDPVVYEKVISDVLDTIAEMRLAGDFDENTLETLEWKLSPPKNEEVN